MTSQALRLLAQDADDLQVISAALQDAVVRLADIAYAPATRTVTFPLVRFRWEVDGEERIEAAVQFGDVMSCKVRGMDPAARDAACSLLAIEFVEGEAPGGDILLRFAGVGDLRMQVECVDVALVDVRQPWPAASTPRHEI